MSQRIIVQSTELGGVIVLGNNKKTIGVLISQVNAHFQEALSRGIIAKARELDYNVAFFTSFGGYGHLTYDLGELAITDLPDYESLEGIILASDTLVLRGLGERYKANIKERTHCPVVSVRRENKDYYSVLIDDNTILNELISHFIEVHGFTRINFLAGPKGFPDSDRRLEAYKRILAEHNLPIEEDRIFYGDFWRFAGKVAVEKWLNSPLERPQAIICANDYMAFSVIRELSEQGIDVPDQIAVTGCDDVEDAPEFRPSLTTVRVPFFEMGAKAVEKIDLHNREIDQPRNTFLDTETQYRASCGCKRHWYSQRADRRNHVIDKETLQSEIANNAFMSADFTGLTKLETLVDKMSYYVGMNEHVSRFFMTLFKDWDYYHNDDDECRSEDYEEVMMDFGMKGTERLAKCKYLLKDLIPPALAEDKPVFYYFTILHHDRHCFGYTGISFSDIRTYMHAYQAWLINISNALENIRIHGELNRLVYKLEDMSIRDDLTDLYNRRVINTLGKNYLDQCVAENSRLMVFTADMDKLKYINDHYGHSQGDIALKVVSNALQIAADDDEICIRLGGDEFMAIGMDYDEAKAIKFVNKFVEELNKFNFLQEYEFGVYVSYGYYLVLPDENTSIEECLLHADSLMYRQKYDKEAKHIKANLVCL